MVGRLYPWCPFDNGCWDWLNSLCEECLYIEGRNRQTGVGARHLSGQISITIALITIVQILIP